MGGSRTFVRAALLVAVAIGIVARPGAQNFDLVIANGRVMDPESGLDAVRNIGIAGRKVVSISTDKLTGRTVIDATGLVVAPGFIDLHAHGQIPDTYRYQALDGVTTALELEVGTADIDGWYAARKAGRLINYGVIIHTNTEEMVAVAIVSPLTMIASDAYWEKGTGHPRTTGTFSRVLGRYVREAHAFSLMDAIRKMTLMPAERLQARVPAMAAKGRLRPGGDADITIFDPSRVIDRSTYREPALAPVGIQHVIVNGVPIVSNGQAIEGKMPGVAVRAPAGRASR
jgi:N-acyl-D-aspartate/D-glutamate deacylase